MSNSSNNTGSDPFDLFLAHNSQDKPAVEAVGRLLQKRGFRPWLDKWHLRPGMPFQSEIEKLIPSLRALAVFVGLDGTGPWERMEIMAAISQFVERGMPVIPVLLPGVTNKPELPLLLREFTWVRFGNSLDDTDALDQIEFGITGIHPRDKPKPAPASYTSDVKVDISRLPITEYEIVGREQELAKLSAAWESLQAAFVSIVAMGGTGKTALVSHWLRDLRDRGWKAARRVFAWSFYSQGCDMNRQVSAATFFSEAGRFFGVDLTDSEGKLLSDWDKGRRLSEALQAKRTLLVLDGVEPLQDAVTGRLRDEALRSLFCSMASRTNCLCVLTTRLSFEDLKGESPRTHHLIPLEQLTPHAGAELLRRLLAPDYSSPKQKKAVAFTPSSELEAASEEFGGHALALRLLGSYLTLAHEGDIRCRHQIGPLLGDDGEGRHAKRVMRQYAERFNASSPSKKSME